LKLIWVFLVASSVTACGGGSMGTGGGFQPGNSGSAKSQLIVCESPRSQACTREYAPVCGKLNSGKLRTFDNGCTACANQAVQGHYPSACATANMQACQDPRPQICTADYRPVCGQSGSGPTQTYGNACSACGDNAVIGFFQGECRN